MKESSYVGPRSPENALLGLLYLHPDHGYQLYQRLVAELGEIWHLSQSQTYNILNRLEKQGFVIGKLQQQDKLPDRREFHLSDSGRLRFEEWLNNPSGCSIRAMRVEFISRLYFAHRIDSEMVWHIIDEQKLQLNNGLDRLGQTMADTPSEQVFNRMGLEFRIRQLESALEWLEDCRTAFETDTTGAIT